MKFLFPALLILLCSCKSLQVSTDRNTKNTKAIGIEWHYGDRVNDSLITLLDQAIANVMSEFNSGKHHFTVHKKLPKEKDYLTIDFTQGKIVSKGERTAGYIVSTVGLIVTPIALLSADVGFVAAFYYWPVNKIMSQMQLSPNLADDKMRKKRSIAETGALFARSSTQVDKMVDKFSKQLHAALMKVDAQVGAR